MSLKIHLIVSSLLGLFFGLIFHSFWISLLSWLVGWLIDCDHLLDYFLYLLKFKKTPELKEFLEEFFNGDYYKKLGKIYVLAHAWEYLVVFWALGSWKLNLSWVISLSFSYGLHLFLDQWGNRGHPSRYFLLYRIKVGFKTS